MMEQEKSMETIQRYEMISVSRCGMGWQELQKEPEGDWMLYDDHIAALAAKDAAITALKGAVHADVAEFRRDSATLEAQAEQIATMKKALEGAEIMIGYLLEWAQTNREFRANDAESKNAKITLSSVGAALASTAPVAEAGQKEGEK